MKRMWMALVVMAVASLLATGCASKKVAGPDSSWEDQERERLAREREMRERLGKLADELATMVFFDLDKSDLKPEARSVLTRKAEIMKQNPQVKLVIEGHCDERGTAEYNLALGERRARSSATFLQNLGVPANRLSIVSYGKERPLDPGHGEAAWSKNRRDEFKATF